MTASDLPASAPNPAIDRQAVAVATRLSVGILNGLILKGVSLDVAGRQVQASSLCDQCYASAVRLIEVNREQDPATADERLETVVALFAGAVSGYVANHKQPEDALIQVNRERDRLFGVAKTLISSSLGYAERAAARPNTPANLAEAWKRGSAVSESHSGSGSRPSTPGGRPR